MTKTPISADTLKLVQARRALEAEKAAEKARAKEAKKKPELAAKVSLEEIKPEVPSSRKRFIAHQRQCPLVIYARRSPRLPDRPTPRASTQSTVKHTTPSINRLPRFTTT